MSPETSLFVIINLSGSERREVCVDHELCTADAQSTVERIRVAAVYSPAKKQKYL